MYELDYSYSDLTDKEIAAHLIQMKAAAEKERQEEARRMEKARNFRFVAGLC